jgi:D-alanyl-lipoteichoic acid acyltransferase DltB (MBOAT superfamily)
MNKSLKAQNALLLISSYVFYGWWDWRFLGLIFLSTVVDYFVGKKLGQSSKNRTRSAWLWVSIVFNLGLLGFFKYYNFFITSWLELFQIADQSATSWTIKIILPVGISFYTFQTMSYSLDIYNKKLKPVHDFISFAAFVSFFPQLVAGPIERASQLIPQIIKARKFNYDQSIGGVRLMLWGFFKKVVIADNLAPLVNDIFSNHEEYSGGTLVLGAIYFAFQIYCDFSGYSDIAIGTSKLFGIELMSNFKFPYFSRGIAEFWRRWHISLSTWFRDYLYIPIGGSRGNKYMALRNVLIIFVVSGFWHGANWTFIVWGLIHGLLFIPMLLFGFNRKHVDSVVAENRWLPNLRELLSMGLTFIFVTLAWIFFRAESLEHAFSYLSRLSFSSPVYKSAIIYPITLISLEWFNRKDERNPFTKINQKVTIITLSIAILLFRHFDNSNIEFIYFQF